MQPHTPQEVSTTVIALSDSGLGAGDWHIAVRGGGHGPPGTNNIANGVTIDLGMMNSSHYDPERDLARVEPGAAWKDVYHDLLHSANVTTTGGRDGDVGVGGYLLGGGMSYYTGNNGFGCDEVVNFEVVLANGTIVNANSDHNPDLWRALKGGGLNFGIVTAFDLRVIPAVDLAYGQSFISSTYSDEVIDAIVEFTNHPQELSDDALIALFEHDTETSRADDDITTVLIRTNTRGNLTTPSFNKINKIPTLTPPTWSLKSHAKAANDSQIPPGSNYAFPPNTHFHPLPLPSPANRKPLYRTAQQTLTVPNNPSTLRHAKALHKSLIETLTHTLPDQVSFSTTLILQPFPSYFHTHSAQKGGNMLGLSSQPSGSNNNNILLVLGIFMNNGSDASLAIAETELTHIITFLTSSLSSSSPNSNSNFIYLNYASPSQNPLGSYGETNVAFMKDVAKRYDPMGFWQVRVPGGFKVGRVV